MGQRLGVSDCIEPDIVSSPPSPVSNAALTSKLCFAASKGDIVKCRSVIEGNVDVNSKDYDRRTALHIAASDGQLDVVKFLLESQADANSRDRWGHSPLDEALMLPLDRPERSAIEAALLGAGAESPQLAFDRALSGTVDEKTSSPLRVFNQGHISGRTEVGEIETATLLCCAAGAGSIEHVQDLYARRADLNSADYDGRTALHVASAHGHVRLVEWLIQMRADCNKRDSFGLTPLGEAMRLNEDEVVQHLVRAGANEGDAAELQGMRLKADVGHYAIPATEVEIGCVLSTTLKSVIYLATWRGTQVVAKTASILNNDKDKEVSVIQVAAHQGGESEDRVKAAQEIIHEIELLSTLRHPDLVMFLGACFDHDTPFFLTEYMDGGDLERYYRAQKAKTGHPYRPPGEKVMRWSSSVARALCFLHGCQQPIIHRDLKPLNLLLNHSEELKVTDFGISKLMAPKVANDDRPAPYMSGGVGTWRYMAPEVVRYQQYGDRADIFSFALIMWFMSTGRQPFVEQFGEDAALVLEEYQRGGEPRPVITSSPAGWPGPRLGSETTAFRQLIQDCWHVTPGSRPSAAECTQRLATICAKVDVGKLASFKDVMSRLKPFKK